MIALALSTAEVPAVALPTVIMLTGATIAETVVSEPALTNRLPLSVIDNELLSASRPNPSFVNEPVPVTAPLIERTVTLKPLVSIVLRPGVNGHRHVDGKTAAGLQGSAPKIKDRRAESAPERGRHQQAAIVEVVGS